MTNRNDELQITESIDAPFFPTADELISTNLQSEFNEQITELSKKGYQQIKMDELEEAISSFKQVLELDKDNNYALVGLGDAERKKNNFSQAIMYYNKCLSLYPENNYALFGLADSYKAQNMYSKAIEIWEQYLLHDEKNITVLTRIADAYRKIHDFKRSKQLYLEVLKIDGSNAYALIGLGHLQYDFKEYKDALFYWTRMYDLNKPNVDVRILTSIGNCHRKLRTYDKGVYFFEQALEISPNNFYALFGLADCYRGMNQPKKSMEYWNKILDIDPNNKVILTRIGDALRSIGDYKAATEYYNKALNIDFDTYAALGLALICKSEERYEEAIERLSSLIKDDKKNYRLYIDLADCYLKLNRKNEALELLKSFQRSGLKSNIINNYIDQITSN